MAKGEPVEYHVADDKEYWKKLKEKLSEEFDEFSEREGIDELVDILEIIEAIVDFKKFDWKQVQTVKAKKVEEKGKFKDKIILERS
jgi:predicted house-cleaning noncanonical NTP pyrophosphatase (MazG superfamily)